MIIHLVLKVNLNKDNLIINLLFINVNNKIILVIKNILSIFKKSKNKIQIKYNFHILNLSESIL
jgi:hypothetical protein